MLGGSGDTPRNVACTGLAPPHRLEPSYPGPEVVTTKSPAPPVVVECWSLMVGTMDRVRLDRFTRSTWQGFDPTDLEPLKAAILRRRRALARGAASRDAEPALRALLNDPVSGVRTRAKWALETIARESRR